MFSMNPPIEYTIQKHFATTENKHGPSNSFLLKDAVKLLGNHKEPKGSVYEREQISQLFIIKSARHTLGKMLSTD